MKIAIIGRTEILHAAARRLHARGHEILLVVTSKEAPEYESTADNFETLAASLGARCIRTAQPGEIVDVVRAMPAMDIAVSLNYNSVIPQSFIDQFRLGIINGHGGDLPRFRGNACQAWAILNGEERVGLCIHRMIGGEIDSGDIVARDYFPLTEDTKITTVWDWMSSRIPELFEESLDHLAKDPDFFIERQSRDPDAALRCYPRRPEDGRVDWSRSALEVLRLVNASNRPYAGAFCELDQQKLVIWDACLVNDREKFLAVPGQVTQVGTDYVEIATGDGKLRLREVEFGGVVAAPSRFIRSIRVRLD